MNAPSPWDSARALRRIQALVRLPGALLPILHALQDEFGYIDEAAIPLIAEELNLSKAEVYGTITFYHDFRLTPPGRHLLQVCCAEACQSMDCAGVVAEFERQLGIAIGQTTPDSAFTLKPVYCLGNCALSPAAMLDGQPYGRLTPDAAAALVARTRTAAPATERE
jgi:formate dehydrogenase subunit gamma